MLKLNQRGSSQHLRVYVKKTESSAHLRFELEIKPSKLKLAEPKKLETKLITKSFVIFEEMLVKRFLKFCLKTIPLNSSIRLNLIDFIKTHKRQKRTNSIKISRENCLVTAYFKSNKGKDFIDSTKIFRFLQFASFIRHQQIDVTKLEYYSVMGQTYYNFKFSLSDFVEFIAIKNLKQAQRTVLISWFHELQTIQPILNVFDEGQEFTSHVVFPIVRCVKMSNKFEIQVLMSKEFILFSYPFIFPSQFLHYSTKNEMKLKLFIIKSFAIIEYEKELNLEEFFNSIQIQNKHLKKVKLKLIELLKILVQLEIIENRIDIFSKKGKQVCCYIKDLKMSQITKRIKVIKFYEIEK